MFTGIIEATGWVKKVQRQGSNINITLSCPFVSELQIDQSVAHSGCCLTVVDISEKEYTVNAIDETLLKTNLWKWEEGTVVNLERCTKLGGRLDGHIVQGHVDRTGTVESIENKDGSYYITVSYDEKDGFVTVPQGSITMNGISLTVARSERGQFSVAIIPYTWQHTNLQYLKNGDLVNLEFDIIGKYVAQLMQR